MMKQKCPTGMNDISSFIATIRDSFHNAEHVYMHGSCFEFYKILKHVFPDAEPHYDEVVGHVYTKIGSGFYDIRGRVKPPKKGFVALRNRPDIARKLHRWKPKK